MERSSWANYTGWSLLAIVEVCFYGGWRGCGRGGIGLWMVLDGDDEDADIGGLKRSQE